MQFEFCNKETVYKTDNTTYYHNNKKEILNRKDVSAHSSVAKMGVIRIIKWFC